MKIEKIALDKIYNAWYNSTMTKQTDIEMAKRAADAVPNILYADAVRRVIKQHQDLLKAAKKVVKFLPMNTISPDAKRFKIIINEAEDK